MARIKPSIRSTETYTEPNFLRLYTVAGTHRTPTARLVTIEHLSYEAKRAVPGSSGWRCETIVDGEEMSKEDALFIAQAYARENDIPVIYECHGETA